MTLVSDTAYHSFIGEVEALNTTTIRRLTPSRRHQLLAIAHPEAWDMLMFGLRLGNDPRVVVTTTPKPIKIIRELIADPTTVITRGSTYDNRANLAPAFLQQIVRKYEGTRLGRQELNPEILDDVPGALWSRALIEETRPPGWRVLPRSCR
jgi:phage terminase large subunit-like protein